MARMTNFRSAAIATGNAINDSAYDNVKIVADNIAAIIDTGEIQQEIDDINTEIDGIDLTLDTTVVRKGSQTGAMTIPVGTTAQRPVTPLNGYTRFNTDLQHTESYREVTGTWGTVGSSQFLGTADTKAIQYLSQTTDEVLEIPVGTNAMSIDSLTIENGGEVIVPDGSVYKVV